MYVHVDGGGRVLSGTYLRIEGFYPTYYENVMRDQGLYGQG